MLSEAEKNVQLKMTAEDGKNRLTDVANTEQLPMAKSIDNIAR